MIKSKDYQAQKRSKTYERGLIAEARARQVLEEQGWTILDQRARMPGGEIDLIALDDTVLVFLEVKRRKSLGEAAYSITTRQQLRIATGAEAWLAANPEFASYDMRFDAILLAPGDQIQHIRSAFDASDMA